jgi:hypothetical protein
MKKFTKVLESKLNNDDIKDIFLSLEDMNCDVQIIDGYLTGGKFFLNIEDVKIGYIPSVYKDSKYAKYIQIRKKDIWNSVESIYLDNWEELKKSSSNSYFMPKDSYLKYKQLSDEVNDCLKRIETDYLYKGAVDEFVIIVIGGKVEQDDTDKKQKIIDTTQYLYKELQEYLKEIKTNTVKPIKATDYLSSSETSITFSSNYRNYRDVLSSKLGKELFYSLDVNASKPENKDEKVKIPKKLSDIKNEINKMGYSIKFKFTNYSLNNYAKISLIEN